MRRRLSAQRVSTTTFSRPAEVVAHLGAVQAQDYLGALWAVGLRLVDARERDVERAIAERSIVRSWPMRGTLHFVAAEDARWMTELCAPRAVAKAASRFRKMGLDEPVLARARDALAKELSGGRRLTRPEAYGVLERAGISMGGERGLHVLWRLAHDAVICFGPRDGKQHTVVLLDEWLPRARRLRRDEALRELATRYFTGHGPATLRDFAWWTGLTLAEAKAAVDAASDALVEESIEGERYWLGASAPAPPREGKGAWVLPAYDEIFVGYADRSAAIAPSDAHRFGPFEVLGPAVVVGDRLVATWKRRLARGTVGFSTSKAAALTEAQHAAVARGVARYARFLELEAEMDAAGATT